MVKEKTLKNQGLEFREDIVVFGFFKVFGFEHFFGNI